jgi:hypothetical protein
VRSNNVKIKDVVILSRALCTGMFKAWNAGILLAAFFESLLKQLVTSLHAQMVLKCVASCFKEK